MKAPPLSARRYAVCVDAGEHEDVDLVPRKVYEVWPDADAESHGWLRVVDESGENYLFPSEYFRILTLPPGVDRLIRASSRPPERRRRAASKARR
ncbi:MAG: hypothetical protein ACREOF_06810 [Gemmatimonadales bacterium]